MNLWVRSQDKLKIVNVNYVYAEARDDHFTIIGETIDSAPIIGMYKTKERALEVLDEIDNMKCYKYMAELSWNDFIKMLDGKTQDEKTKLFLNMNTYEMPKE